MNALEKEKKQRKISKMHLRRFSVFLVLLVQLQFVHSKLKIRRQSSQSCHIWNFYCRMDDYFENPIGTQSFCELRNAHCLSARNCIECKCNEDHINFVSYTYGCLTFEKATMFLSRGLFIIYL